MKTLLFSLLSVLSFQLSIAQSNAEEILNQVKETLFTQALTKFDFKIAIVNHEANFRNEKDGSLTAGDNQYILEFPEDGTSIFFNGTTRWSINTDDEEVIISNVEEDEADLSFTKYFENYKGNYTYKLGEGDTETSQILLTPKDKETDTKLIEVNINIKDHTIRSISEHGTNGTIRTINVKTSKVLETGSTSFKPNLADYTDFEVIDMR